MANLASPIVLAEILLAIIIFACMARLLRLFGMARVNVFAGAAGDILPRIPHANRIAFSFGSMLLLVGAFLLGRWDDSRSTGFVSVLLAILCIYLGLHVTHRALAKQLHMRHNDRNMANDPILIRDRLALALFVAAAWLFLQLFPQTKDGTYSVNDPGLVAILVGIPVWLYCCGIVQR